MSWCLERTRDSGQDARQERQENLQEGPPRGPREGGCPHITQTYPQALPQAPRGCWRPLRPVAGGFGQCEQIWGRKWGCEVSALLPRRFHQICLGEDLEEQESLGGGRGISWHPEWSPRGTSVCHERQRMGIPEQTLCWLAQQGGHPLFQFPELWREELPGWKIPTYTTRDCASLLHGEEHQKVCGRPSEVGELLQRHTPSFPGHETSPGPESRPWGCLV